ncbi:Zinc finger matrin-type protein 4 [Heterocephalus glaber]|uniref:Zinc finger matrin-type protein 4 n=1 Tax=Heterocephalus glaber TaxID=10181 RepID=G5APL2_HETGA|nr:Zinc finger matrin-type protein 4 [Heterocephalus glaber]
MIPGDVREIQCDVIYEASNKALRTLMTLRRNKVSLSAFQGSDADTVDKNKCCTLCNMSFTSAVVADSHYQGKIHAKRLKLLLGEKTPSKTTATPLSSLKPTRVEAVPVVESAYQRRDSDRYCGLCAAWFNNPLMAQQHYEGKKHKKNAARVALLEQLGTSLDMGELRVHTQWGPLVMVYNFPVIQHFPLYSLIISDICSSDGKLTTV